MLGKEAITWGNINKLNIPHDPYSISHHCWELVFNAFTENTEFSSICYTSVVVNDALKRGLYVRG